MPGEIIDYQARPEPSRVGVNTETGHLRINWADWGQAKISSGENVFSVQLFTNCFDSYLLDFAPHTDYHHLKSKYPRRRKKFGWKQCGGEDHFEVKGNHRESFGAL